MLLIFCSFASAAEKIMVFGDSLSAGYGIDIQQGWVALLQQRLQENNLDYTVVNASISGDTTSNGLSRLPDALTQNKPNIVILELGGNDGLRGLPLQVTRANLAKMISLIKDQDGKVLLVGVRLPPNYGLDYITQFQAIYKDLADKYDTRVVPLFLNGVDDQTNLMQQDGIHPNTDGQPILLENIWAELKPMLN